jgi:hypothetical protein
VEAELAGQARRVATIPTKSPEQERFWKHWQGVKEDYELVQREVLAALYDADCKPRLAAWRQKAHACLSQPADTELAEAYRANEAILALISEGQRVSRDLTPYVEGGVAAAVKDHDEDGPPKLLTRLAQLREWNYNRSALDWIDRTERSTGTALDKLTSLAKIDESRLAPYVGQRLAEVWKKLFEDCSKEDKVEATKRRILREYQ